LDSVAIFWFRRDMRLVDNHGLYRALQCDVPVLPIFIFDRNILDELPHSDARVQFIHNELTDLKTALNQQHSDIRIFYGHPIQVWKSIVKKYNVVKVFTNHDYEPYALERDQKIELFLGKRNIEFSSYKDHVIFEKKEILSNSNTVYTVFTPYKKKWLSNFQKAFIKRNGL